jgi:ATP-dependent Clp protease ATP-binding subunit ClpA
MFERFTERAIKVIIRAQQESGQLGFDSVGTEAILLGLIAEPEGIASGAFASIGITIDAARQVVFKIVGKGTGGGLAEKPFTPRSKTVLERAANEAKQLGDHHIGTSHLLLSLLAQREGAAVNALEALGIDVQSLRKIVLSEMSGSKIRRSTELLNGVGLELTTLCGRLKSDAKQSFEARHTKKSDLEKLREDLLELEKTLSGMVPSVRHEIEHLTDLIDSFPDDKELRIAILQILRYAREKRLTSQGTSNKVLADILAIKREQTQKCVDELCEFGYVEKTEDWYRITDSGLQFIIESLGE